VYAHRRPLLRTSAPGPDIAQEDLIAYSSRENFGLRTQPLLLVKTRKPVVSNYTEMWTAGRPQPQPHVGGEEVTGGICGDGARSLSRK
jgi:hypothetical protein